MKADVKTKETAWSLYRALSWLVSLLVPVALVLTIVRAVMTPVFLQIEYRLPGFPIDRYGFTLQDRLYWSEIARDYLLNSEDISFLADLRFEDGTAVYNARELRHMVDVKRTVQAALVVWYAALTLLVLGAVWAWRVGWWQEYREGLARGGWLTTYLLGAIVLFVLVAFNVFFVAFHEVFFEPGTWTFLFSDTLIRLFPERFWRDLFILVGGLALAGGLGLGFGLRRRS